MREVKLALCRNLSVLVGRRKGETGQNYDPIPTQIPSQNPSIPAISLHYSAPRNCTAVGSGTDLPDQHPISKKQPACCCAICLGVGVRRPQGQGYSFRSSSVGRAEAGGRDRVTMFKNTFQSGFLSILYSIGSKPLQIWDKQGTRPACQGLCCITLMFGRQACSLRLRDVQCATDTSSVSQMEISSQVCWK